MNRGKGPHLKRTTAARFMYCYCPLADSFPVPGEEFFCSLLDSVGLARPTPSLRF